MQFLSDVDVDLAPRLIALDSTRHIVVLEDLTPRVPLRSVLLEGDPDLSRHGLAAFARSMGELHALTVGRADEYYARRRSLGPVDPEVELARFINEGGDWSEALVHADALGVPLDGSAESELAEVLAALARPGPFLAFSNGDSGVNNFMVDARDGRFIDFEFAGYRHALTDAKSLYVPGPMWMTVSDPVASGLESAYRSALASAVPEASDDDLFGFGLSAASIAFAIHRLVRFPRLDARPSGDESRVQMIFTLEAAAHTAETHASLPNLRGWTRNAAAALRRRWAESGADMRTFADYSTRH